MNRRAIVQPRAERDIDERVDYLEALASQAVSSRFLAAVLNDIVGLLVAPETGSPRRFRRLRLRGSGNGACPGSRGS